MNLELEIGPRPVNRVAWSLDSAACNLYSKVKLWLSGLSTTTCYILILWLT
jgi:hypothetical protein